MSEAQDVFEHDAAFETGEVSGTVHLGKFEAQYEELFAEALEDGVITADERVRLDRAAGALGLERGRLMRLERALEAAYEARHRTKVSGEGRIPSVAPDVPAARSSVAHGEPARTTALERRIVLLEARIAELESELAGARANVAVEVDLSAVVGPPAGTSPAVAGESDEPPYYQRRVRHDPADTEALRALYSLYGRRGEHDRQWCAAHALVFRGAANEAERAYYLASAHEGLIRPQQSVSPDAWRRQLFHPDEEVLTGEIFSIIVSAVLLGRVAALRRDKALPALDPAQKQDPSLSTLQAVRAFAWAAQALGMVAPALYADPHDEGALTMVPGLPPASRLGKQALIGRSARELAFLAGRHLAWYREEHFIRLLVPGIAELEDLFLAALAIGNPAVPLSGEMKRRVAPVAAAIEPVLEPIYRDRLRGYFLRFVEDGGRTNLQRWATAADRTAARAGLLLADDLSVAAAMLRREDAPGAETRIDDLVVFVVSDRYANLRAQLGIAAGA